MNNLAKLVYKFRDSKNDLYKSFQCRDDLFVKVLDDYYWSVDNHDDFNILSYWKDGMKVKTAVTLMKDDSAYVLRKKDFSLVVAIDCVQIGFIFKTNLERTL